MARASGKTELDLTDHPSDGDKISSATLARVR